MSFYRAVERSNSLKIIEKLAIFLIFLSSLLLFFISSEWISWRFMYNQYSEVNFRTAAESNDQHSLSITLNEYLENIVCHPGTTFKVHIFEFDHPLAEALSNHPAATKNREEACLSILFMDKDENGQFSDSDLLKSNSLIINLNEKSSITMYGSEVTLNNATAKTIVRPIIDFTFYANVEAFNNITFISRPYILPLNRTIEYAVLVEETVDQNSYQIPVIVCNDDWEKKLLNVSFCLIESSESFHKHLLYSLRSGCIPVVLSLKQRMPFNDEMNWNLASLRFPRSAIPIIPKVIEKLKPEDVLEMRRMGRVLLDRLDNADALSRSLIAMIAGRLQLNLPLAPEIKAKPLFGELFLSNSSMSQQNQFNFSSNEIDLAIFSSRMQSYSSWNSGRDLRFGRRSSYDTFDLPTETNRYSGIGLDIKSLANTRSSNSFGKGLGLTRHEEKFTVIILTYNRDGGVGEIIRRLNECPYLAKIIVIWNNLERSPPEDFFPIIHVPVEFFRPEKNSLNNRFLPYDRIETEAVVSIDDDMDVGHAEIVFAFRVWRQNRDTLVGFVDRYTDMSHSIPIYGAGSTCEYSMILTSFAFFHKEFLFEYTYNQHPMILAHVDEKRNCEDIAISYLVAHLTRKAPLKVQKKTGTLNRKARRGLSNDRDHYTERDECVRLFNAIYGYNPLKTSQMRAVPSLNNCVQ